MMPLRRTSARFLIAALLTILVLSLTGCNQWTAKRKLKQLRSIMEEIQVHEGEERPYVFRESEVSQLESQVNQIGDLIAREQYQEAADLARRVSENAPALRDTVIQDHATALFEQADEDIQIAEANDGRQEDPDLWNVILETRESARTNRSEQKWENVIADSQQIIDDVRTLLLNLSMRAQSAYNDAINEMETFEVLSSESHVPALVVLSRQLVDNVSELIGDRSYRLAIATAEEALTRINETIIETKRSLSDQGISRLEALISEVVDHGGDFRLIERYSAFSDDFERLLSFFYQQEFDQTLAQITLMTPVAQQLVLDTYQREASELIDQRGREINQLIEAEVENYLEGRIEIASDFHTQAQQRFDEAIDRIGQLQSMSAPPAPETLEGLMLDEVKPIFNASVQLSLEAGDELDNIHQAFRELSENHLHDAASAINVADEVLNRFPDIWDPRMDRTSRDVDVQFEQNKEMLHAELTERLESARTLNVLGDFSLNDTPPRYNITIQYADQARDDANAVLGDTYRVVAQNSLIELTWLVNHYESEGAGEYTTGELDRTVRLIQEARDTLEYGDPREAVSQCAAARAQLDVMAQALQRVANTTIQDLRVLEEDTASVLDEIQDSESLGVIIELRQTAERMARSGSLKDAIETAQRGIRLAATTSNEAAREWAQEEITDARGRIAHAADAGAAIYAATLLQDARDLAETARRRFAEGDFFNSQVAAAEASMRADAARLHLINEAESAAVRARNYDGFRFQSAAFADSLVALERARRAMDAGEFVNARELAIFAKSRADEIAAMSQQGLFIERIEILRASTQHAINTGASYFQPEELEGVLDELADIERDYSPVNHDDHERNLQALEARVALVIEGTPEILNAIIADQTEWVAGLREVNAERYAYEELNEAIGLMVSARGNFDNGHHRTAYREVRRVGSILTEVQMMADEFVYKEHVEEILADLASARFEFAGYLSVNPIALRRIAIAPGGSGNFTSLASNLSPTEFRQEVERLLGLAEQISPPPTRREHHAELQACLRNAQSAARNFEYLLVADQMDEGTIEDTVDSAYRFLEDSQRGYNTLRADLMEAPLSAPSSMTELGRPYLNRAQAGFSYGNHR